MFANVQAIRYYVGAYATATCCGFMVVMRDLHAREVYRLSRRLAAWGDGDRNRLLFDVAPPRDGAPTMLVDVVLVSPRGLAVFCVQEGRGSAYGDVGDGHWIVVGSVKRGGSEWMVPNLGACVSETVAALRGYLLMDGTTALPVASCAVFSDAVDVDHVEVAEGVMLTHVRDVASPLDDALPVTADEEREDTVPSFDDADLKRRYRVLRVCANMPDVDADGEGAILSFERSDRLQPTAWLRGVARRGLSNVTFRLLDWECVLPGQNAGTHDVIIASWCQAMMGVEKLSALARKKVAVQIFADAPSIPAFLGVLYSGWGKEGERSGRNGSVHRSEGMSSRGPQGSVLGPGGRGRFGYGGPGSFGGGRARSAYIDIVNRVYGA